MRLALRQEERRSRTFAHWKRLFDAELARAREQERMRMAYSRDWSHLGEYVGEGFLIMRHSITLNAAGLLFRLRCPGASRLFDISVTFLMQTGCMRRSPQCLTPAEKF